MCLWKARGGQEDRRVLEVLQPAQGSRKIRASRARPGQEGVPALWLQRTGIVAVTRPALAVRRPERIAIRDQIVRCYYRSCWYVSGPYLCRDDTAEAARAHYLGVHAKSAMALAA